MENSWIIALYFSGIAACLGIATALKIQDQNFSKAFDAHVNACRYYRVT